MLLHIFVPQLPLRRLHGRASVIVHQNGIVADYVVVTPPQWKIVGPSHLFRQKRTGVNVGLVVRIGIVPLRDAVIEIVINQIVLNERILQAGEIEGTATNPAVLVHHVVFNNEISTASVRKIVVPEFLGSELHQTDCPFAGWLFVGVGLQLGVFD